MTTENKRTAPAFECNKGFRQRVSEFLSLFKVVYDGKLMTCYFVKNIGRIPLIGMVIKKSVQHVCGIFGHTYDADWGYCGGEDIDVWCRFCDHFTQAPKTSIWFRNRVARHMMNSFDEGNTP